MMYFASGVIMSTPISKSISSSISKPESISISLPQMGWNNFFQQQLSLEECTDYQIGRVISAHRTQLILLTEQGQVNLPVTNNTTDITVGDWLLIDRGTLCSPVRKIELLLSKSRWQ